MTPAELDRLAHHVNLDRPDWQLTSLRTWIAANLAGRPYLDALHAFLDCAADPATKTPARVLEAGPWWRPRASESVAYYGPQATQCRRCGEWPSPGEETPYWPKNPAIAADPVRRDLWALGVIE